MPGRKRQTGATLIELLAVVGIIAMLALAISGYAGEALGLYYANWRAATVQSDLGFALTHMSERLREGTSVTIVQGGQGISFRAWDSSISTFATFSFTLVGETIQTETGFVLSQYVHAANFALDAALRTVTISLTSMGPSGPFEAGAGLPITLTNRIALRQPIAQVGAGTVTRLWTFDTDAAGWTSSTHPHAVATVSGVDGHPAPGSLQGRVSGRNRGGGDDDDDDDDEDDGDEDDGNVTWQWTGSLASLGVPPGTRVVGAQLVVWWRVAEWHTGEEASWRAILRTTAGPVTLIPERSGHAAGGWMMASGPHQALVMDAHTVITLQIVAHLETGNAAAAAVTLRWDSISLTLMHAPH